MKHNFPSDVNLVCETKLNKQQMKEIFHLAIDSDCIVDEATIRNPMDKQFPHVAWNGEVITQTENLLYDVVVSHKEFLDFLKGKGKYTKPFEEKFDLGIDISATVTKKSVKVGCKTININKVIELAEICKKAKKSKL